MYLYYISDTAYQLHVYMIQHHAKILERMFPSVVIAEQSFQFPLFSLDKGNVLVHLMRNSGCEMIKFVLGTEAD